MKIHFNYRQAPSTVRKPEIEFRPEAIGFYLPKTNNECLIITQDGQKTIYHPPLMKPGYCKLQASIIYCAFKEKIL